MSDIPYSVRDKNIRVNAIKGFNFADIGTNEMFKKVDDNNVGGTNVFATAGNLTTTGTITAGDTTVTGLSVTDSAASALIRLTNTNTSTSPGLVGGWNEIRMGLTDNGAQSVRFITYNDHDAAPSLRRGYQIKVQNRISLKSYVLNNSFVYSTLYNASSTSDDRLKFNETPITNALTTMRKLNPVTYDKSQTLNEEVDTQHRSGFIAQEVYAIEELKHAAIVGDENNEWSLFYDDIFTHSVAAIKELDTIVQSQQTEIDSLKARLTALENTN
jgi:hypothetical protein